MAQAPILKIYRGGTYVASCKYLEDAAILVGVGGGTVRFGHGKVVIWREGNEAFPASESYDHAAAIMQARITQLLGRR